MKYLLTVIMLLALSGASIAQSADQKLVSEAIERLNKAMIDADETALKEMTSDSLSYGHSDGRVERKKNFIESLKSGKSDFVTISLSEQTISISNNNAIVRHVLSGTTNDNGNPGNVRLKVLQVWQKEKGKWKLLARQAVKFA